MIFCDTLIKKCLGSFVLKHHFRGENLVPADSGLGIFCHRFSKIVRIEWKHHYMIVYDTPIKKRPCHFLLKHHFRGANQDQADSALWNFLHQFSKNVRIEQKHHYMILFDTLVKKCQGHFLLKHHFRGKVLVTVDSALWKFLQPIFKNRRNWILGIEVHVLHVYTSTYTF